MADATEGRHRHECPECGTVWEHADDCVNLPYRERTRAHACPRCGAVCARRYHGECATEFHDHHLTAGEEV